MKAPHVSRPEYLMSNISMPNEITEGRAMSCFSLGVQTPAATGMFNAASDWAACCVITIGGSVTACQQMAHRLKP